jgi:hypothetical protein
MEGERGGIGENCQGLFKIFLKFPFVIKQIVALPQSKFINCFLPLDVACFVRALLSNNSRLTVTCLCYSRI